MSADGKVDGSCEVGLIFLYSAQCVCYTFVIIHMDAAVSSRKHAELHSILWDKMMADIKS